MYSALTSLVEDYRRTRYLFLLVVGFNPSKVYVLLYVAPMYGNSSMFTNFGKQVGYCVRLLIFVHFLVAYQ